MNGKVVHMTIICEKCKLHKTSNCAKFSAITKLKKTQETY